MSETSQQRRRHERWLNDLAAPARRQGRVAAMAVCASGALLVAQAGLIAWLLQQVLVAHRPWDGYWPALAALGGVLALRAGLQALAQHWGGACADTARRQLRGQVYRQLLERGPAWLRRQRSGELSELLLGHAEALEGYFSGYRLARAEVMVVPLVIVLAVACVDRVVMAILLGTAPLVPLFMILVGWGAEAAGRAQLRDLARMGGRFADRLKGLGLLRLYGRGQAELEGVRAAAEGVRERSMKVLRIAFLSSTTLEFFASISVAMVALYLGLGYLGLIGFGGGASLGVGMFCLLLAPEFYGPLRRLAAYYHDRANALAAAAEIERLLAPAEDIAGSGQRRVLPASAAPLLVARHLALRPPGMATPILHDLCFQLQPGQRLALLGTSGSGKSTLLETLAGWLPPAEGELAVRAGVRIGYAGQRPYLFQGTIAENLRLAAPEASLMQLLAAAEAAQVMRFVECLPLGLDTVIGERGFGLSGGQARRIALARSLLRRPDLLLLDEPTAFLDPGTEADLLGSLGRYLRGGSVIVATHSAAVAEWAGKRLWLTEPAPLEVEA